MKQLKEKSTSKSHEIESSAGLSSEAVYLEDNRHQSKGVLQMKNNTGLPDKLKSGAENLSGHSLDDVKVHYNSSKPAQLNAHAFAQGTQIHLAAGQEKHLAHETWHVVQQKQGRVKPTTEVGGVAINDSKLLEKEADQMGGKAASTGDSILQKKAYSAQKPLGGSIIQLRGKRRKPSFYPGLKTGESFFKRLRKAGVPRGRIYQVHEAAMKTIDKLLPLIMNALPFESLGAGINFGQEVVVKWLTYTPQVLEKGNLQAKLEYHLRGVINSLKLAPGEEGKEDGEDEHEGPEVEKKPEGESDPRYVMALHRVKEKRAQERTKSEILRDNLTETYQKDRADAHKLLAQPVLRLLGDEPKKKSKDSEEEIPDVYGKLRTLLSAHGTANLTLAFVITAARAGRLSVAQQITQYHKLFKELGVSSSIDILHVVQQLQKIGALDKSVEYDQLERNFRADRTEAYAAADWLFMKGTEEDVERRKKAYEFTMTARAEREKSNEEISTKAKKKIADLPEKLSDQLKTLSPNPLAGDSAWTLDFVATIMEAHQKKIGGGALLKKYEELFAERGWPPGNETRTNYIALLGKLSLMEGVDVEVLEIGSKSASAIIEEAQADGWITRSEVEIGNKLLGPRAFAGIVASHIKRGKPGPLRGMIEQITHSRHALLAPQPKMTSSSLVMDTNLVEVITTPFKRLTKSQQKIYNGLINLIQRKGIRDLRLANINVAELHGIGNLIGKKITLRKGRWVRKLKVFGIPVSTSRGSQHYDSVFQQLESSGVGERKGNADRSMIADMYVADRTGKDQPHFATADQGITKKIGSEPGQFNPEKSDVGPIHIHTFYHETGEKDSTEESEVGAVKPTFSSGGSKIPHHLGSIFGYKMGKSHTVADLMKWIEAKGHRIYVVGGAVRDSLRGEEIHDVDVKTNMPYLEVIALLKEKGIQTNPTPEIRLVKAGTDPDVVDITCSKSKTSDLNDEAERDFTVNAMRMDVTGKVVGAPDGAEDHAKAGVLRFMADPGKGKTEERVVQVIAAMKREPELLGRALKFMQRGYKKWMAQWEKRKSGEAYPDHKAFHLEAEILDGIRSHAVEILKSINLGERAAGKKALFIHKSGFSSPMEMVQVMSRLNFPTAAIQMVIPDSLAGRYDPEGLKVSYSRNVSPRNRAVGPVKAWNPKAAPKLKVDTTTGSIYQYRFYAIGHHSGIKGGEHLLIDVDYTEHGVDGHPSPHYHIFRDIDGKWEKNASGFSRTGQPGIPSTKKTKAGTVYTGPMPWTWVKKDLKADETTDAILVSEVRKACRRAGLSFTFHKGAQKVSVGKQITLHLSQLRDVANEDLTTKLLTLVHNLSVRGVGWDPADQATRELTSGKSGKVRLRFDAQLKMVDQFLTERCKLPVKRSYLSDARLSDTDKARIFDLVNANVPEVQCVPAAMFAYKNSKSVNVFVERFEFFLEATKQSVPMEKMEEAFETASSGTAGMVTSIDAKGVKDSGLVKHIQENTASLGFERPSAAAYHMMKHADMVERELGKDHGKVDLSEKETMKKLAVDYIKVAREVVEKGKLSKTEHDRNGTLMFTFQLDSKVAFVRISKGGRAFLLSSFDRSGDSTIRLALRFLDEQAKFHGAIVPEQTVFNTKFGRYKRLSTLGDGNCLYRAIRQSAGLAANVQDLRDQAAQELANNWDTHDYGDFIAGDRAGLLARAQAEIRRDGAWNTQYGDIAPMLIANALGRRIHVLSSTTGALISTQGTGGGAPIIIFYNGHNHYSASRQE